MPQVPGRRLWVGLFAPLLAVALAVGAGEEGGELGPDGQAGSHSSSSAEPSVGWAPTDGSDTWSTDEVDAVAAGLLSTRSQALAHGNRAAWESTVADPASDEGSREMAAYDALLALGVTGLSAVDVQVGSSSMGAPGDPEGRSFTVTARIGHQIPGYDRAPREATRTLTLVSTPSGWRFARDAAAADQLQVWDLPGLQVVRSATSLVAGDVPVSVLTDRLADADAATRRLTSLFGSATPSVVVVPATAAEAARQLGRPEAAASSQVAATTDGQLGPAGTAGADRVVLGPDAFARLTEEGRRVVVTHELTHVATRASTAGQLPLWLSEGFAEYIAWGPVNIPVETAAAQLRSYVRSNGAPDALPATPEFDSSRSDLATAYQGSWLAVRLIGTEHGEPALWAFYLAVAGTPGGKGMALEDAFRSVLGTNTADFVAGWRAELQKLAR
ncbi:MAG: hypothetical protein ACOYBY_13510 [Dermatophilaceae bacterium]